MADALWPDSEGDAARRTFDSALFRARSLLGTPAALVLKDGRISLDPGHCWTDAAAFLSACSRLEALEREHSRKHRDEDLFSDLVKAGQRALDLYKGLFLPADLHQVWSLSLRQRLHQKHVRAVKILGRLFMDQCRWEEALELFENALAADDLVEEFHQNLMICLSRLDRKAEAVKAFDHCRAVLDAGLGVSPSHKTVDIYMAVANTEN